MNDVRRDRPVLPGMNRSFHKSLAVCRRWGRNRCWENGLRGWLFRPKQGRVGVFRSCGR